VGQGKPCIIFFGGLISPHLVAKINYNIKLKLNIFNINKPL